MRLRESLLRLNKKTTGHRLLRGGITVGGARVLALPDVDVVAAVAAEVAELADVTLANSTVRDRFTGTAILGHEEAARTRHARLRRTGVWTATWTRGSTTPSSTWATHFSVVVETGGDVLARYLIRVRELGVSAAVLIRPRTQAGQATRERVSPPTSTGADSGLGLVEGWRGTIAHRVELDAHGVLSRVKVVDPSFFNWPALPVALADTIVPDFPLANKSFNQSYAGNDL